MIRVAQWFHDEIVWHFMSVGHTNIRPNEGFGHIRRHVGDRTSVLSINELKEPMSESAAGDEAVLFPVDQMVSWKYPDGCIQISERHAE